MEVKPTLSVEIAKCLRMPFVCPLQVLALVQF